MTLEGRVLDYVRSHPWASAAQTAKALGEKSGSVASILKKLVGRGKLIRKEGWGPRGGYGYFSRGPGRWPPTWHERLMQDEPNFGE